MLALQYSKIGRKVSNFCLNGFFFGGGMVGGTTDKNLTCIFILLMLKIQTLFYNCNYSIYMVFIKLFGSICIPSYNHKFKHYSLRAA